MTTIPFYKMSGAGNDFIIIDNRRSVIPDIDVSKFAAQVCRRKLSVGGDGLILLETSDQADFKWRFFNSDGSVAEMCGNGARCAARIAYLTGLASEHMTFETRAGLIQAQILDDTVRIKMTDPGQVFLDETVDSNQGPLAFARVNTGVPHIVLIVTDIETAPVVRQGRELRYHHAFAPAGTNVNFISPADSGRWLIRTYERGVEDETLACGTGNVAAALVLASRYDMPSPINFITRSRSALKVHFQKQTTGFDQVFLEGDARMIYTAELMADAWQYGV